jgi:hypothetical protein
VRRLILTFAVLALVIAPACKKKRATPVARGVESVVEMNDPAAASQLKSGFYGIESGSWRWTNRDFTVQLMAPPNAQTSGARLRLKFAIPDAVIGKTGPMELSAAVHAPGSVEMKLDPERYTKGGTYEYTRDVDASVFQNKGAVTVEFACDKSIPPTGDDRRELALIAVSAGLEPR